MKTIKLEHITKIEGHANLTLSIEKDKIKKCELGSVEGSRYFEGLLQGRNCMEAPEITSRICGICSCAHTVASIKAIENALNIKPSRQTALLRELAMIGERIRSHATHLYFLALPDYLGFESALEMAQKHKTEVERALSLTKLGNSILSCVGSRDLHPISIQAGNMLKIPDPECMEQLKRNLQDAQANALATAKLFATLKIPKFDSPTQYMSLYDGLNYPMMSGDILVGTTRYKKEEYDKLIAEYHESFSTANFVVKENKRYLVGALARVNNNYRQLSKNAKKALSLVNAKPPFNNPFLNNFCQAIELIQYVDRGIEICRKLELKPEPNQEIKFKKSRGIGIIEVPRGILIHDYEMDEKGMITKANIVTPTAQNLLNMQEDIRSYLPSLLKLPENKLILEVEKLIRSYDPCFSCSTHFLKVNWEK